MLLAVCEDAAIGLFRFTPKGLVQRGLAVFEVEPQGTAVVSPTAQSFQGFGY